MHVVELPDETEAWAKSKAEAEGFLTLSDYMVFLVERQKDIEALRQMLSVGMEGEAIPAEQANNRLRDILGSKTE